MSRLPDASHARAFAARILSRHHLPWQPMVIDEIPGIYGIRTPECRLIVARSDGRILYLRRHPRQQVRQME
ncbi:MAG: hypothetical protein Q4A06_01465 [Cardiobacteriaceae bacterium]|nr:hypothetical protein [Cardiobacteriaceae bacterium]